MPESTSATHTPIVFMVEDDPTSGLIIERTILHEMPGVRLLWSYSVAEAATRAAGLPIDLFICDVCLPDGSGIDFLWRMAVEHPMARAIVMTATPLPEHRAHTAALGVLHFIEKPVKPQELVQYIRTELGAAAQADEGTDFRATLKNVTPVDIVQLKCLTQANTIVEFVSGEFVGRIRFQDGEITDASVGDVCGVEAFYTILGWKHGQVREFPPMDHYTRNIDQPWHTLIMDAAQRLDERPAVEVG
jgi:response regulator RpfG family c-di-GMP phosphodiesterase